MLEDGEFADVGATVNAWLGGSTPPRGVLGKPFVAAVISAAELIQRKRDGEELSPDEIAELVLGYARGRGARLPDGRVLHGRLLPRALEPARPSR